MQLILGATTILAKRQLSRLNKSEKTGLVSLTGKDSSLAIDQSAFAEESKDLGDDDESLKIENELGLSYRVKETGKES